jgi:hypothetical protein
LTRQICYGSYYKLKCIFAWYVKAYLH